MITKFLDWYEKHVTESLIVSAIVLYLQIPHTVSASECFFFLDIGLLRIHPIIDFLLYGIDLLEIIPIIGVTLAIISKTRHKFSHNINK